MEIFTLLESLEEIIENSRSVPFSGKGIVDKDELFDLIKEIRIKLPDELKQAKWVKEERQRILVEAWWTWDNKKGLWSEKRDYWECKWEIKRDF